MAISGPSSYPSTTDEFITHWGLANTALGAGNEITLKGGVTLAMLMTKKTNLVDKRTLLQDKLTLLEVTRGDLQVQKESLLDLFNKFTDRVRSLYAGTKWERALPTAPGIGEGLGEFTEPMDKAAALWKLINDDPALADIVILGVTQAGFVTLVANLKATYTTRTDAGTVADVTREERNDIQDEIYAILKSYRQALPSYFATGHALIDSLPRLTPEPGATPEAVTMTAVLDPATNEVVITHSKSTAANFARYQYRLTRGTEWSDEDDEVIDDVTDINALEFRTTKGVEVPNVTAVYKAFVITTGDNERGSEPVVITRPADPAPP
jgi:hypothetical protein